MFNYSRYLYKATQVMGLVDAPSTGIGNPPSQPPMDGENDDNEDFIPDNEMVRRIFAWAGEKGINEVGQDVTQIIIQVPPKSIFFTSSRKTTNLFLERGTVNVSIIHVLQEDMPQSFLLENSIRNKLLSSSIWKYLGIPYERGFKYMQNGYFMQIIVAAVSEMVISKKSNDAAFWIYEESDKYIENLRQEIVQRLGQDADPSTLKLRKIPKSAHSKGKMMPPGINLMLYSDISFTYEVSPWKYEQKSNAGAFYSLPANRQKAIMLDLHSAMDDFEAMYDKEGGLEAIVSMSGNFQPATQTYEEEEHPEITDIEYYPSQVEHFIDLQSPNFDILGKISIDKLDAILQAIPPKLLHLLSVTADVPAEVEEKYKPGTTSVTTELLLDNADTTSDGKLRLLIVPIEKEIK